MVRTLHLVLHMHISNKCIISCLSPSGFDQQINDGKALADAAIGRLPGVNATIKQAVKDNAKASSIFQDVSTSYNDALGTVTQLENLVDNLEVRMSHLRSNHQAPPLLNLDAHDILSSRDPLNLCWVTLHC